MFKIKRTLGGKLHKEAQIIVTPEMAFLVLKFGICGRQGREKPTFVDDVPATPHNMSAFA